MFVFVGAPMRVPSKLSFKCLEVWLLKYNTFEFDKFILIFLTVSRSLNYYELLMSWCFACMSISCAN